MPRRFGLTAMLVGLLPVLASAHLEFFCASAVFSNSTQFCNKAVIWLGTYAHNSIPDQLPVPGKAIVYTGDNPVQEEPFTFDKYCASSTSTTGRFDTLSQPPTVTELEDFIKGLTQDDCLPGMSNELSYISPDMELTCWTDNFDTPVAGNESARCPSARATKDEILGALIPIVLDNVRSTDDISIVVHSTGFEVKKWPGDIDACSVASTEQIDEDNSTCYMNINNWDGSTCGPEAANTIPASTFPHIKVGGCGVACGPYIPQSTVANNDCTAAEVPSGTTCNIACGVGETLVGRPVSCQAGEYIGNMICTTDPVAWIGDIVDDTTPVIPNQNLDQITTATGPGCGEFTAVGTTCYITCGFGYFSTGTVSVINDNGAAVWLPSPDAACVPTTCGSGTAIPTEAEVSLDNGADSIQSGNFMNDGSFVISQPGCNFDPASDKIIVIPREAGSTATCDGSASPTGGVTFSCGTGASSSATLLECTPDGSLDYASLPLYGQICVCDADFEQGCTSPSQFSKQGGVTDTTHAPTAAPTDVPTESPSAGPTHTPSHAPSFAPSASPTDTPTEVPTRAPTAGPTGVPTTESPTGVPTAVPTELPSFTPTHTPSASPTDLPSESPTATPSHAPTFNPTARPTESPTHLPTHTPSRSPTDGPSHSPTVRPTETPSDAPSFSPSHSPSEQPTRSPTRLPTRSPTRTPSRNPTRSPTRSPTQNPTHAPSSAPTVDTSDEFRFQNTVASSTGKKHGHSHHSHGTTAAHRNLVSPKKGKPAKKGKSAKKGTAKLSAGQTAGAVTSGTSTAIGAGVVGVCGAVAMAVYRRRRLARNGFTLLSQDEVGEATAILQ